MYSGRCMFFLNWNVPYSFILVTIEFPENFTWLAYSIYVCNHSFSIRHLGFLLLWTNLRWTESCTNIVHMCPFPSREDSWGAGHSDKDFLLFSQVGSPRKIVLCVTASASGVWQCLIFSVFRILFDLYQSARKSRCFTAIWICIPRRWRSWIFLRRSVVHLYCCFLSHPQLISH